MPQEVENKCCKLKKCITLTSRFTKLCLDPDVLELCIRNRADIRNDHEDNSTRAFRKAAYRQYINFHPLAIPLSGPGVILSGNNITTRFCFGLGKVYVEVPIYGCELSSCFVCTVSKLNPFHFSEHS
jgi:hypothetical protein